MFKKGYKQTEEHKRKIGLANKGKKKPSLIGNKHAKKGRSGVYKRTSNMKTGKHMLGRKIPRKTKMKIKESMKGKKNTLGKKFSDESKRKMSLAQIGKHTGNKCTFWKGGISPLIVLTRNSFKYKEWRTNVFIRDEYTCSSCHNVGRKLNAHHIKGFAEIFYGNNIKTSKQVSNCKELWDINNGQTLCIPCHRKLDKYRR